MHIPDGFINATTSLGAGLISVGGLSFALRRAKEFMEERRAPLAGLLAAFIFALQMLNFPVAAGTSGHFMGGLLAAVLVGPWVAVLVMAVVLAMQALLFADGGLSALGLNILNLALLAPLVGWIAFVGVRKALPPGRRSVVFASGVAAAVSVLAAASGFVIQYALGGTGSAAVGTVAGAMAAVHLVIGIGEGVITAFAVSALLAVRPDLVYGASAITSVSPQAALGGRA